MQKVWPGPHTMMLTGFQSVFRYNGNNQLLFVQMVLAIQQRLYEVRLVCMMELRHDMLLLRPVMLQKQQHFFN